MGVCNCSMFCCTLLYVPSNIAIILMGKRELVALLNLSFWCLVMVERLFLAMPRGCLRFVIVVFPDHTHLLFFTVFLCLYLDSTKPIFLITVPVFIKSNADNSLWSPLTNHYPIDPNGGPLVFDSLFFISKYIWVITI